MAVRRAAQRVSTSVTADPGHRQQDGAHARRQQPPGHPQFVPVSWNRSDEDDSTSSVSDEPYIPPVDELAPRAQQRPAFAPQPSSSAAPSQDIPIDPVLLEDEPYVPPSNPRLLAANHDFQRLDFMATFRPPLNSPASFPVARSQQALHEVCAFVFLISNWAIIEQQISITWYHEGLQCGKDRGREVNKTRTVVLALANFTGDSRRM
jgi:hypothetical protein